MIFATSSATTGFAIPRSRPVTAIAAGGIALVATWIPVPAIGSGALIALDDDIALPAPTGVDTTGAARVTRRTAETGMTRSVARSTVRVGWGPCSGGACGSGL